MWWHPCIYVVLAFICAINCTHLGDVNSQKPCGGYGSDWRIELECLRLELERRYTPPSPPARRVARHVDFREIADNLTDRCTTQIRGLEIKTEMEIRVLEQRSSAQISELKQMLQRELDNMNKTVKLLKHRIFDYQSAEYIYVEEETTWHEAERQCREWGGHLTSVADLRENLFVKSLTNHFAWIGFSDLGQEGKFAWTDGSNTNFENWQPGYALIHADDRVGRSWPRSHHSAQERFIVANTNEKCVEMGPDGYWSDSYCSLARAFICKRL